MMHQQLLMVGGSKKLEFLGGTAVGGFSPIENSLQVVTNYAASTVRNALLMHHMFQLVFSPDVPPNWREQTTTFTTPVAFGFGYRAFSEILAPYTPPVTRRFREDNGGANFSFPDPNIAAVYGASALFRDAVLDAVGTVVSSPTNDYGVSVVLPGIIVSQNDSLLVASLVGGGVGQISPPAGMSIVVGTSEAAIAVSDDYVSAGATGSKTFTANTGGMLMGMLYSVKLR